MITRLALGFSAMTSPLSVLLIIGAAVVGPIEAQPKPDAYQNYVVGCAMRNTEFKQAVPCAEVAMAYAERESLPELCERAMREVGAERKPLVNPEWTYPRETVAMWRIDGLPVRCIPTPQGYRR